MKITQMLAKLPFDKVDRFGFFATFILIFIVTWNDLNTLYYRSLEEDLYAMPIFFIGLWCLTNVLGNAYKAIVTDTTINSIDLPTILLPEWRYCSFCEQNTPPRCFHCFTCNKCILKRHNHCTFLGKCAGYKNQRYYLLFILHVWIGVILSNITHSHYLIDVFITAPSFTKIFTAIMPLFALIFGMISFMDFIYVFLNSITLILLPLLFFYMLMNYKMGLTNQTWNENAKNIQVYNLGWMHNLQEILGSNWYLAILTPFSKLKLIGDGIRFKKNDLMPSKSSNENMMNNNFGYDTNNHINRRRIDNNMIYNY